MIWSAARFAAYSCHSWRRGSERRGRGAQAARGAHARGGQEARLVPRVRRVMPVRRALGADQSAARRPHQPRFLASAAVVSAEALKIGVSVAILLREQVRALGLSMRTSWWGMRTRRRDLFLLGGMRTPRRNLSCIFFSAACARRGSW